MSQNKDKNSDLDSNELRIAKNAPWDSDARSAVVLASGEEGFFRFTVPVGNIEAYVSLVEVETLEAIEAALSGGRAAAVPSHAHTIRFWTQFLEGYSSRAIGAYRSTFSPDMARTYPDHYVIPSAGTAAELLGIQYDGSPPAFYFARRWEVRPESGERALLVAIGVGHSSLQEPEYWYAAGHTAGNYPELAGDVVLHAALRSGGDRIENAQLMYGRLEVFDPYKDRAFLEYEPLHLSALAVDNYIEIELEAVAIETDPPPMELAIGPMALLAYQVETYNAVDVGFAPIEAHGKKHATENRADISFRPLHVDNLHASADLSALPLSVTASDELLQGVDVQMLPLEMDADADKLVAYSALKIDAGPMAVDARDEENVVAIEFLPPALRAHEAPGVEARIVLPSFVGVQALAPDVVDGVAASETIFPSHYTLVADGAMASEDVIAGAIAIESIEDGARAGDTTFVRTDVLLEDGAMAGDEVALASTLLVVDGAFASQELLLKSDSFALLEDGALAGDDALPYAFVDITDSALAGDAALIATELLVEDGAFAGDDALTGSVRVEVSLEDGALAGDEYSHYSDVIAFLEDGAIADEVLIMKTPGQAAWVMNTDTAGVSWYDNWAFTSMASVDGKVFASGPDGLVVIGGSADGAEQIDAAVQYGFYELGGYDQSGQPKPNEQKKRVVGLWYGYHSDGVLNASVETYGQGYAPFTYAMQPREANQPRTNRIVPGKGLNARYWRIGVSNTDGCDFEVHSISAEVAASNRRI